MSDLTTIYEKLKQCDDVTAPGELWWVLRPQPPLGTVEIRTYDLPTQARRVAALAAITQAAAATYQDRFNDGLPRSSFKSAYFEQNRWKAMRHGLNGKIVEPESGEILPTLEQLERLFELIAPKAEELGSDQHLEFAREMLNAGTEAQWQIERCEQLGGDLRALELEIARRTLE
jgi:carboxylate-amine ligase